MLQHFQIGPEVTDQNVLRVAFVSLGTLDALEAFMNFYLAPQIAQGLTACRVVLVRTFYRLQWPDCCRDFPIDVLKLFKLVPQLAEKCLLWISNVRRWTTRRSMVGLNLAPEITQLL